MRWHPFDTDMMTPYANAVLDRFLWGWATSPEAYDGAVTMLDLDAARRTEARHEDRIIAAISGALPSEVWA